MIIIRCLFSALACFNFSKKMQLVMESRLYAKFVEVLYADRFKGTYEIPKKLLLTYAIPAS